MKKRLLLLLFPFLLSSLQAQESAFEFSFQQEKSDTIMTLTSEETLPCLGYGIKAYKVWSHDTLIIDIRGFRKPDPCIAGMDAAHETLDMPGIGTKFFYIKFRREEVKGKKEENLWKVGIKGASYQISPLTSTFSRYSQ